MSWNIEVEGGKSVRLPTAGKYCDQDIVVTAKGGGDAADVAFLDLKKTITEYRDDTVVKLPSCAFCGCKNLKMVVLPKVENTEYQELFADCPALEVVDFTALTVLGGGSEDTYGIGDVGTFSSPINWYCGATVKALVNRGGLFQMGVLAEGDTPFEFLYSCGVEFLNVIIYIPREYINAENFVGTPYENDWGETCKKYPNGYDWEQLYNQNRIRAIEDYTVDGTVTGALDFAKMGIDMG